MFDIMKPKVSKVLRGLEGRAILLYGDNGTGKTTQATSGIKPLYLPFEQGLTGIEGIPYFDIHTWSDWKKIYKSLTNPSTLEQVKEKYQTLVFDGTKDAAELCQAFICNKMRVKSMSDTPLDEAGKPRGNTWTEYGTEFKSMLRGLLKCGYTVIFLAKPTLNKETIGGVETAKWYPEGDKRSIKPISDMVDIIGYLVNEGDGLDRDAKSTLHMGASKDYKGKSRGMKIQPVIKEFTLAKLEKAVDDAIKEQEAEKQGSTATYEELQENSTSVLRTTEELKILIQPYVEKLVEQGRKPEYLDIVETYLGQDGRVSTATKHQNEQLELILTDLQGLDL